jgi:hypothetical protein
MIDRYGNNATGATAEAMAHFDNAVHCFGLYRGDPISELDRAAAASHDFVMVHLAKALLLALTTEPASVLVARESLETAQKLRKNERETSLTAATTALLDGEWSRAAVMLDHHGVLWPYDLLSLQAGHLVDFFRGNARNLRDRIARALPAWSPEAPGYPLLLGMHAFGLEECADYAHAEATGRHALSLEPLDCWAHHAVAHVMEMQDRAEDGIGWMVAREQTWAGDDNFFKIHNWWHRALYHLALQQTDAALALYDGPVRGTQSQVAVDLVDASALLWRLSLCDCDVGDRWIELAEAWEQHADGQLYPFNDWHAVMADLGAGREDVVATRIKRLRSAGAASGEIATWIRATALPLVEGFAAFAHGDYSRAAELLYPVRFIANSFGGSHAQRDVIDWTLAESALRGNLTSLATALAHERLALKPDNRLSRDMLKRVATVNARPEA